MALLEKKLPLLRLSITGLFMGLANLVPGVSGGTMVLALGLYDEFITAMSDVTRLPGKMLKDGPLVGLKSFGRSGAILAMLFGLSFLTIAVLSGIIQYLMAMFQPGMLALFIGMTLGGAPMLWRQMKPLSAPSVVGAVCGFTLMALVALVLKPGGGEPSWLLFFLGGMVASSAMILPGISGSYMLLIMGLYLPVIAGISDGVYALKERDFATCIQVALNIGLPVGLGLLVGIVGFSNLIKICLEKFHAPTIGFLMGLLVGSVLGLYPFQVASFDKLPRYAHEGNLKVMAFGWEPVAGNAVYDNLQSLNERPGLTVSYLPGADRAPMEAEIEAARAINAVVIVYDHLIEREVRKAAATEIADKKVELVFVPNAEQTPVKIGWVILLAIIGFGLTLLLSRLGGGEKSEPEASPAAG
ncbi:MAG: DUF368 domain-containing protein [Sumerlaeia bacterium]